MQILAIIFSVVGGLSELFGLGMVIREIGADRKRARTLLAGSRQYRRPQRQYPSRVPRAGATAGYGGVGTRQADALHRETHDAIAILANSLTDVTKRLDEERDDLEEKLLKEVDQGDDDLRQAFREVLESDLTERWVGVTALGVGIVLAATGSVLGSLS